ncbi:MAG: cold shock domain-containing protein [Gammaproteobacteria bacterium]|nr:cold shock domain-containing protein [Gammaproteobacteria bacterium]
MSIKSIVQWVKNLFCPASSGARQSGTIKFFDRKKRFGFIIANDNEYFFHVAATRPRDFKGLQDGVAVTFVVIKGKKGPQADQIEIVR